MIPATLVYQLVALVAAAAVVGTFREARLTRRMVEKHERELYGGEVKLGLSRIVRRRLRHAWSDPDA